MIRRTFALLGLVATFSIASVAQPQLKDPVQVELTVRGRDGQVVANRTVELKLVEPGKTPQPV